MFLTGKLLPHLPETEAADYDGYWQSEAEKEATIDHFYSERPSIPLSLDHRNTGTFGFIRHDDVCGEVLDLYKNRDGYMVVKARLSPDHPAYQEVNHGINSKKENWGFSVGLAQLPGDGTIGGQQRKLMHVALTNDPGFADHDTFIDAWSVNEDRLNAIIARDHYRPGEAGRAYASPVFDEKLKRMRIFASRSDSRSHPARQPGE